MKAVDTNILARWLARDDDVQTPLADQVMRTSVYIPLTVLIELAWLLTRSYRFTRTMLNDAMRAILNVETIAVASENGVRWAIDRHADGADLPDMLHLVASYGADAFLSFEKRLADLAGPDSPVPVERVT